MHPAPQASPSWTRSARAVVLLLALPLSPAALTAWLHPKGPEWAALLAAAREQAGAPAQSRLSVEQALADAHGSALWIDARPAAQQQAFGRVPDALTLTEDAWEAQFSAVIDAWDGQREFIVYCGGESCHASEAVARRLRHELGFEKIHVLDGGWDAYLARKGVAP
jgi:rhodanese-related sulfurtransferase